MKIIATQFAVKRVQFRFPRTKKKRIRAKWAKREGNVRYQPQAFKLGGTLYVHPSQYAQLKRELETPLAQEWEANPQADRCGMHLADRHGRPHNGSHRCFRPAGHAGECLF